MLRCFAFIAVALSTQLGCAADKAPAPFKVKFETTAGNFTIEVTPADAPLGAARFRKLVEEGYYNECAFFRVPKKATTPGGKGFVVQFGLAADPKVTKKWDKKIKDDPVKAKNLTGTVCFATAGPNTRTTQLFISLKDNSFLDRLGFAPFGKVVDGMKSVHNITDKHAEKPDQGLIEAQGNAYLKKHFPGLDYIKKAYILKKKK